MQDNICKGTAISSGEKVEKWNLFGVLHSMEETHVRVYSPLLSLQFPERDLTGFTETARERERGLETASPSPLPVTH